MQNTAPASRNSVQSIYCQQDRKATIRACITLVVLAILMLLNFGSAPIRTLETNGKTVVFDLTSIAGCVAAVYGLFGVLFNRKRFFGVSNTIGWLAVGAAALLIVHAAVALAIGIETPPVSLHFTFYMHWN